MDLHSEIMNIPVKLPELGFEGIGPPLAYKIGHRDARHAAAELSLKAEARIEKLEGMLKRAYDMEYIDGEWIDDYHNLIEDK